MRLGLMSRLAWHDYRREGRLSACAVLALVAVLAPLLVLFGLKFGLISTLTERLERDPGIREVIPLGAGVSPPSMSPNCGRAMTLPSSSREPGRSLPPPNCPRPAAR